MAEKDPQNSPSESTEDKDFGLPKVTLTPLEQKTSGKEINIEKEHNQPDDPRENKVNKEASTPVAAAAEIKSLETEKSSNPEEAKAVQPAKGKEKVAYKDTEKKSGGWIWAALVLLALLFGGVAYWYTIEGEQEPQQQPVAERQEQVPPTPVEPAEPEVVEAEPEPETYTVTQIKSRAGSPRYFVVVGSFLDEDTALEFSQRLNDAEINTYLVYPYGDIANYRLAVGQYDDFATAYEELERVKSDYSENLWVLKY